jgi:AmmeMemoRadiSam system protein B
MELIHALYSRMLLWDNPAMKRMAVVAGQFYDADPARLAKYVEGLTEAGGKTVEAKGIVAPHAGLMFSGQVAGAVYSRITFPETFVLLGPNHTGMGTKVSMMGEGEWEIPTGEVQVDSALAASIVEHAPLVTRDTGAHLYEHSLEVQLPFIHHFSRSVRIVPITVLSATLPELLSMGEGIAEAVAECGYHVVVVASSDMSHFIPDEDAREKDRAAIDRVLALDPEGLFRVVRAEGISMCGYMPVVIMLAAVREMEAKQAELVKYMTSAEVSGDYGSVVGYAGVIVS